MNTVFVRSSVQQDIPEEYSSGFIFGPIRDKGRCRFRHTLDRLLCRPREPGRAVQSLAILAVAVYLADKTTTRSSAEDAWTRQITLSVPADEAFTASLPVIERGVQYLSGDRWSIRSRIEPVSIGARRYFFGDFSPDAICLFSGGIDSLTGAIDLLEKGRTVVLVSHFESGWVAGLQRDLVRRLCRHYGPARVGHLPIMVRSPGSNERSTRARSILFVALGLMAASAYGDDIPVHIPENGFLSINAPLSDSRQGSYSTRTTHPYYMACLREGLRMASIRHDIFNPFFGLSKGQVLRSCANPGILRDLLPHTVSCAKAGWTRWQGQAPGTHCGFCYPCLVRRAALHAIDADTPGQYLHDAIGSPEVLYSDRRGKDLRSFLLAVSRYATSDRSLLMVMLKSGPLSMLGNPEDSIHVVRAGLGEFADLVSDKACPEVRAYARHRHAGIAGRQFMS